MSELRRTNLALRATALRHLASVLGATFLIEESDSLVDGAAQVVRERGTTYSMVGSPNRREVLPGCASRCRSG